MASIARPAAFRQAFTAMQTQSLTSKATPLAFRYSSTLTKRPMQQTIARDALKSSSRVAAFHATARRPILPAEPQVVQGTVNDPVPVPKSSPTHGNYHWSFERLIAAGLVPLTVAPFIGGSLNPVLDATLCATLLVHSHIGFQALIIDYIPTKRVPVIRKIFWWGLNAATVLVGVGLYEFETNDVGVTEAIKKLWHA